MYTTCSNDIVHYAAIVVAVQAVIFLVNNIIGLR